MNAPTGGFAGRAATSRPDINLLLKFLLVCRVLNSALCFAMNAFIQLLFNGYSIASQTVSELSAICAPKGPLWVATA